MELKIALEWDETIGVLASDMYPIREGLELLLQSKPYGEGVSVIWIVLIARERELKLRKRFVKKVRRLEFDVILDFQGIYNLGSKEAKILAIKQGLARGIESVVSRYKKLDFKGNDLIKDTNAFLLALEG